MKTKLLKMTRRLWDAQTNPWTTRELNRANQLKWARAVAMLGDKWLFAKHVQRKDAQ
jgi:hypothetical protein